MENKEDFLLLLEQFGNWGNLFPFIKVTNSEGCVILNMIVTSKE